MNYRITPIKLGNFCDFEKSSFTYGKDAGTKLSSPVFVFLVQGNGKNILFDSGPVSPQEAPNKTHRLLKNHISLLTGLQEKNISPKDIDAVVLSHLHWDHSYNLEYFNKIPIYVQKKELEYALVPLPCQYISYNVHNGNGLPQWLNGYENFKIINGDYLLHDGLELITLPGHTPGLQGLAVNTQDGRYILCSDQYPLLENYTSGIPSGIIADLSAWYKSHEKVIGLGAKVLPAHDDLIMKQQVYGA